MMKKGSMSFPLADNKSSATGEAQIQDDMECNDKNFISLRGKLNNGKIPMNPQNLKLMLNSHITAGPQ